MRQWVMLCALIWAGGLFSNVCAQGNDVNDIADNSMPDDTVIAQVADQIITGGELRIRYIQEIAPGYDTIFSDQTQPTLLDVADMLVREKAMALEAREIGLLNDPTVSWSLENTCRNWLIDYYAQKVILPTVRISQQDVQNRLASNDSLTRDQVIQSLMRQAVLDKLNEQIDSLHETLHVTKHPDNMAQAASLYSKLLNHPVMNRPRNTPWVLKEQILNELTPEQHKLVLVEYDGGAFTLVDLMKVIHGVRPTNRPKDLITGTGVEKVVDSSLGRPLLEVFIRNQGIDKQPEIAKKIRDYEDQRLLSYLVHLKSQVVAAPTQEEIEARFEQVKDRILPEHMLNSQVIWCEDANQAAQVKASLDKGQAVEDVLKSFGLDEKYAVAVNLTPSSQGMYWAPIWAGEPNDILGPCRGFNRGKIQWRVVKVIKKTPREGVSLESRISEVIYSLIYTERRDKILKPFQDQLLKKYDSNIFVSRLFAFDPLN